MALLSFSCAAFVATLVPAVALMKPRPEFGPPLVRVMAGQDDCRERSRNVRIREFSWHRLHVRRSIEAGRWGWECGRPLDLCRVMFEPLCVIEGDRSDDAAAVAIGGREAAFLDGTLGENNLVAERADAHRFDVHAKLAGPERGQRQVRPR